MTDINKQKFLNELNRLLTFMYEEDRQTALNMYSEAFDYAEDQEALLLKLSSPTRQAVIIARSYNAKERKLQIYSQSRGEDGSYEQSGEVPAFIEAIEKVLPERPQYEAASENENIYFEEAETAVEAVPAEDVSETEAAAAPIEESGIEADDKAEEEICEESEVSVSEELPAEEVSVEEPQEAVNAAAAAAGTAAAVPLFEELARDAQESQEHFEAEGIDEPEDEPEDESEEESLDEAEADDENDFEIEIEEEADSEDEDTFNIESAGSASVDYNPEDDAEYFEPRLKANIPLLILFILLAVPVTLALIAVILIPAAISLAIACCAIYAGAVILVAAFGGFAVFADILVVLGLSLIVLSLGLLFLTLFIWFIADVIVGLVKGVISMGRKWCFKEVSKI